MSKAILVMDMPNKCEEWKDVIGYEGIYQVSNLGRVRNKDKILKPSNTGKYRHLALCKSGTRKDVTIHRLVAEAFIPNPHNYPCINHIDENKENNVASNLEWCDYRHNLLHSTSAEELSKRAKEFMSGETNPNRTQVLCVETGKVYESIKDASEELGIDASQIVKVCKGKANRKTAGGYHWKYYNACIDEILGGGE